MRFKIDKGIPIPTPMNLGLTKQIREMEVGDSFFIPVEKGNEKTTQRTMSSKLCVATKGTDFQMTVRKVPGGFRAWKIERNNQN